MTITFTDQPAVEAVAAAAGTWTFALRRDIDLSGYSGTGIVADGAVFADGETVMHWRGTGGRATGTVVARSLRDIVGPHTHDGATRVMWTHGGPETEAGGRRTEIACVQCAAPMVEVSVRHPLIRSEGRCVGCGLREVWELAR